MLSLQHIKNSNKAISKNLSIEIAIRTDGNMIEITQKEFTRLVDYLKNNYGIDLSKKKQLIEGRLYNTLVKNGFTNFSDYIDFVLKNEKTEIEQIINKLTTNHTYFMRESSHFDIFKKLVLPTLENRKRNKTLGVWSAGCSSGQEPYTLSMILKDHFMNKPGWDTRVLATDISHNAMERAEKGEYDAEGMEDVPAVWKSKYFTKSGNKYTVTKEMRDNVIFREFNLMNPINFKIQFDVIFCRNVMIYFDQPTKNALIRRFYDATLPGGYLFIGHSETIDKNINPYKYLDGAAYIRS